MTWEQPPACRHDGEHITDKRIAEATPRTICSTCGAELTAEPGTPQALDEVFTGVTLSFMYADEPARDPVAALFERAREQGELVRVIRDGKVIGYFDPAAATHDDNGHHIRIEHWPDTPTDPADPPTS